MGAPCAILRRVGKGIRTALLAARTGFDGLSRRKNDATEPISEGLLGVTGVAAGICRMLRMGLDLACTYIFIVLPSWLVCSGGATT